LYDIGGGYTTFKWALARLNGDLDLDWDITLPQTQIYAFFGSSMIMLKNGDIALASICRRNSRYCAIVVILHDGYDVTPENSSPETPFAFYPNPVKDAVTLTFAEGNEPTSVAIYDLTGRLVGMKNNGWKSIDMSTMSAGVYMLRVTMKDGTSYNKKIIKE
jgi:hypothetical protein